MSMPNEIEMHACPNPPDPVLPLADRVAGKQNEILGSEGYVAPEVIRYQMYAPACDNWACGILLYNMLAGDVPFDNDLQIKMGELCFYQDIWKAISVDAKVRDGLTSSCCPTPTTNPTTTATSTAHIVAGATEERVYELYWKLSIEPRCLPGTGSNPLPAALHVIRDRLESLFLLHCLLSFVSRRKPHLSIFQGVASCSEEQFSVRSSGCL